jgi:hypothetical protein
MADLLERFAQFFFADGWDVGREAQESVLRVHFAGENGQWGCFVQTREEYDLAAFYSVYPDPIPADQRPAIADLVTWANFDLMIGNFELAPDSGYLRFKTSVAAEAALLALPIVHNLVYHNVLTMDRYYPAIVAVLAGESTPRAAVAAIEQDRV